MFGVRPRVRSEGNARVSEPAYISAVRYAELSFANNIRASRVIPYEESEGDHLRVGSLVLLRRVSNPRDRSSSHLCEQTYTESSGPITEIST